MTKKIIVLITAGIMVLVSISFSANAAVLQQQTYKTVEPTSVGRLEGTVKNAKGNPIEGALIRIFGGYIDFEEVEFALVYKHTNSSADGSYSFDIPSGTYTMLVTMQGTIPSFRFTVVIEVKTTVENFHLIILAVSRQQQLPILNFLQQHLNLFPILKILFQRLGLQ
jgi:hypothetical protein